MSNRPADEPPVGCAHKRNSDQLPLGKALCSHVQDGSQADI